jgi:hypothetical protein
VSEDLLRLLAQAHPDRPQGDLLAMLELIPSKSPQKPARGGSGRPSIFPFRKPQRPPVRAVATERRRRLAYSGPLPPQLAARFTLGELSCLRIIADEIRQRGFCALTLGAISARAGCCRELARRTLRKAEREGLLTVEERRRPGQINLPNVVRMASKEWASWVERGPRPQRIGPTKIAPSATTDSRKADGKGFRGVGSAGTAARGEILRACADRERAMRPAVTPER